MLLSGAASACGGLVPLTCGWVSGDASLLVTAGGTIRRMANGAHPIDGDAAGGLMATPLAGLLPHRPGQRGQQLVEVLIADVAAALQPHQTAGGLAFPQEAHVLIADR